MTATARKTTKPAPASDALDWDALLENAELTDRDTKSRPTIDVPDKVVAYAEKLYADKKRATFPVKDTDDYNRQKLIWQSAADKASTPMSATITEVRQGGNDDTPGDLVGIRVSMGERRGVKNKPATNGTAADE